MSRGMGVLAALLVGCAVMAQGVPPTRAEVTAQSISEELLGGYFSMNSLVLTENNPGRAALVLMGGRLVWSPVNANAYTYFDSGIGLRFGVQLVAPPGGVTFSDYLASSQQDRPVRYSETRGFGHVCQAAIVGTCGVGTIVEGTTQCLQATVTSRTRYCTCTSNGAGSPAFAWALSGGAGSVGTATVCPEVTP